MCRGFEKFHRTIFSVRKLINKTNCIIYYIIYIYTKKEKKRGKQREDVEKQALFARALQQTAPGFLRRNFSIIFEQSRVRDMQINGEERTV